MSQGPGGGGTGCPTRCRQGQRRQQELGAQGRAETQAESHRGRGGGREVKLHPLGWGVGSALLQV